MIFFITVLRALAACIITNAHYTGVYPTDLIANGGLIGDVIFFAVSGYCLYGIKLRFPKWYAKRLLRCYLPVLIATLIYMLIGSYDPAEHNLLWWYLYPTYYHFVASIIVLYVPYYFIIRIKWTREHLPIVGGIVAAAWLIIYVFFYDKSHYHIDTVREPMIRFLFMESMLLGAWFRQNDQRVRNVFSWWNPIGCIVSGVLYFTSKMIFVKYEALCRFQFVNQILIFILLYFIFRFFASLDEKLEKFPVTIKKIIYYLADITLEIYVVQYVLIEHLRKIAVFPLNWLLLTSAIIAAATLLHFVSTFIIKRIERLFDALEKKIHGKMNA